MKKLVMAMTYQPKIEPVKDGRCTQTIRAVRKGRTVSVGDEISFIMWKGRWICKRVTVTTVESISVSSGGVKFYDIMSMDIKPMTWNSFWCTSLAIQDFIDPPTGEALRDVLFSFYGAPGSPEEYQIIRW